MRAVSPLSKKNKLGWQPWVQKCTWGWQPWVQKSTWGWQPWVQKCTKGSLPWGTVLYSGQTALGPKMYIGHPALGTKMYPGLHAPGTRGRAEYDLLQSHQNNIYVRYRLFQLAPQSVEICFIWTDYEFRSSPTLYPIHGSHWTSSFYLMFQQLASLKLECIFWYKTLSLAQEFSPSLTIRVATMSNSVILDIWFVLMKTRPQLRPVQNWTLPFFDLNTWDYGLGLVNKSKPCCCIVVFSLMYPNLLGDNWCHAV